MLKTRPTYVERASDKSSLYTPHLFIIIIFNFTDSRQSQFEIRPMTATHDIIDHEGNSKLDNRVTVTCHEVKQSSNSSSPIIPLALRGSLSTALVNVMLFVLLILLVSIVPSTISIEVTVMIYPCVMKLHIPVPLVTMAQAVIYFPFFNDAFHPHPLNIIVILLSHQCTRI